MYKTIKFEIKDKVAVLTLNRPDKLNALSLHLIDELIEVLNEINQNNNIRAVVLTGEGKAFCAGADLSEANDMESPVSVLKWLKKAQNVQLIIEESPKVFICSINGYALGGGLEVALACDIRIASSTAILGLPEINSGLLPGGGGMSRLTHIVGLGRAKELIMSGRKINAEEALSYGIVTKIVPKEELSNYALDYAKDLSEKPPLGISLAKETINLNKDLDIRTALINEGKTLSILFSTKDRLEGVQAFIEKRKPVFIGE